MATTENHVERKPWFSFATPKLSISIAKPPGIAKPFIFPADPPSGPAAADIRIWDRPAAAPFRTARKVRFEPSAKQIESFHRLD